MIQEVLIDTAFTKEGQPDGTDVVIIDPYTGCQLQCPYCFQFNDVKWSKPIFINTNIADLIKKQILDINEDIYFGSKCDPYMQLEEKYHLTRQCLNVLSSCKNHVFINTKADNKLILQDVQLFKSFTTPPTVLMGLSNIKQANKGEQSINIEIANALKANGIDVWCFITPILPHIMDIDAMVRKLDKSIPIYFDKLRVITDGNQDKKVYQWVKDNFPQYIGEYEKILFCNDLTYYTDIYNHYKGNTRFVFLTDEWGV